MLNTIKKAKPFIEKLYIDKCNVYEMQSVKDEETGITSKEEVLVYENVPCKLSHQSEKQSGEGVGSSLFLSSFIHLSPDLNIKAGSKIVVIRNGKETVYKNSGEPANYITHQKIMLELFKEWA